MKAFIHSPDASGSSEIETQANYEEARVTAMQPSEQGNVRSKRGRGHASQISERVPDLRDKPAGSSTAGSSTALPKANHPGRYLDVEPRLLTERQREKVVKYINEVRAVVAASGVFH